MTIVRPLLITVALGSFALTACATSTEPRAADSVDAALQQPIRDLSLLQDAPPPAALTKAAAGPYLTEDLGDCPVIARELAALDAVLGRDIDGPVAAGDRSSHLAAGVIGEVFGLPFRGVVRQISGAQQREATRQAAILAGMVRRAFLKGRASLACPQSPVR